MCHTSAYYIRCYLIDIWANKINSDIANKSINCMDKFCLFSMYFECENDSWALFSGRFSYKNLTPYITNTIRYYCNIFVPYYYFKSCWILYNYFFALVLFYKSVYLFNIGRKMFFIQSQSYIRDKKQKYTWIRK